MKKLTLLLVTILSTPVITSCATTDNAVVTPTEKQSTYFNRRDNNSDGQITFSESATYNAKSLKRFRSQSWAIKRIAKDGAEANVVMAKEFIEKYDQNDDGIITLSEYVNH